ncbi:uncharacterized protein [Branchiostoma lanceolatum]|uniref:uncharacterized protein isoform X2 n=1 Tax=Branchiostoma lanceolatum TaxID=7740 RepID=UPI00345176FB
MDLRGKGLKLRCSSPLIVLLCQAPVAQGIKAEFSGQHSHIVFLYLTALWSLRLLVFYNNNSATTKRGVYIIPRVTLELPGSLLLSNKMFPGTVHRLLNTCVALWIAMSSVVLSQDVTSTVPTTVPALPTTIPALSTTVPEVELQVNNMSTTEAHTTHRVPCPAGSPPLGYDGFCLHGGECLYLADFQEASCRCLEMYWGQRCQYHIPFSQAGQKTELRDTYIIIGVLSALLTLVLVGGIVFIVRRCRRETDRTGPGHTHLEKGQSTDRLTQDV